MALIENLVIALGLRSSGFSAGIRNAGKDLSAFEKNVNGISNGLVGFGKNLLIGAIGFLGFKSVIENIGSAMDRMFGQAMSAAKLGASIEDFTALSYAVGSVGIATEKFDTAVQKMLVTIANAAKGDDSALGVFDKLKISIDKIKNKSLLEQVLMLAGGFDRLQNAAQRMNVARGMFGRGGAGMLNLFKMGTKGIEEMIKRAEYLGVLISKEDMSKVIGMRNAWYDLGQAVKGMWNSITIGLSPAMTLIFTKFANLIADTRKEMDFFLVSTNNNVSTLTSSLLRMYIVAGSLADIFKVIMYASASISSWIYGAVEALSGNMEWANFYAGVAEKYSKLMDATIDDLIKNLSGDKYDELLEEIKKMKLNIIEGTEGDFIGGGSEIITPGAYQRGTKEAAEAASKAGATDNAVEYAHQSVLKLAELNKRADAIDAKMLAISNSLGLDAGIV